MAERQFTTCQVADVLGTTPDVVTGWIRSGQLESTKQLEGPVRISQQQFTKFLKKEGIDIDKIMAKETSLPETTSPRQTPDQATQQAPEDMLDDIPASSAEPVDRVVAPAPEPAPSIAEEAPAPAPSAPQAPPASEPAKAPQTSAPTATAQVADAIVADAVTRGADAVHLDISDGTLSLRLRLHGVLEEKAGFKKRLPESVGQELMSHFKTLVGIAPDATGLQSGSDETTSARRDVRLTISAVQTSKGERLVIRIADLQGDAGDLSARGLIAEQLQRLKTMLGKSYGLILVAAPPRSGSERTLRAMLANLADEQKNVLAVDRRGAPATPGITQCVRDFTGGFGWAEAMAAVDDLDCDAISVADVCEPATAVAAVEAASTGCMVLGAVRCEGATGAIDLLGQMGVGGWSLASVLLGVVSQRTVRALCGECKKPAQPAAAELLAKLNLTSDEIDFDVYAPQGCPKCGGSGYLGEAVLCATLANEGAVTEAIRNGESPEQIVAAGVEAGMSDLAAVGLAMLRAGTTSLEELARVRI